VTLKVINALKKVGISDLDVKIVVGPSNPNTETLQNAVLFAPCALRFALCVAIGKFFHFKGHRIDFFS